MQTITKTRRGWLLSESSWSEGHNAHIQGAINGRRYAVPWSSLATIGVTRETPVPDRGERGTWLGEDWDVLCRRVAEMPGRLLAEGHRCR